MITKEMWQDIFADNDQTKAYFDLCSVDSTEEGVEKHHILPKSLFPQYAKEKWNLVKLSYVDHYKAHEILPFICNSTPLKAKMLYAWNRLINSNSQTPVINSETYAILRIAHKEAVSKAMIGNKSCTGQAGNMLGKTHSDETKAKMSLKRKGVPKTEAHIKSMRECCKGEKSVKFGKKLSAELIEILKLANAGEKNGMYGKKHSDETKEKIRQKALNRGSKWK